MKWGIFLIGLMLLIVQGCGKKKGAENVQTQNPSSKTSLCLIDVLTPAQYSQIRDEISDSRDSSTIELRAQRLTRSMADTVGIQKTEELLRTGLLLDWLADLSSQPCKMLNP